MIMPLVPPVTEVFAEVAVEELHVDVLVISNDMMHPVVPDGQEMGATVTGLPVTLRNIRSVAPF